MKKLLFIICVVTLLNTGISRVQATEGAICEERATLQAEQELAEEMPVEEDNSTGSGAVGDDPVPTQPRS